MSLRSYFLLWKICIFIMWTFLKRSGVKQKIYRWKIWFLNFKMTFCDLYWPLRSYFILLKKMRLYYVSIHIDFYQNRASNRKLKSRSLRVSQSQDFFVRYRRTYFLNNNSKKSELNDSVLNNYLDFFTTELK